MLRIFITTLIMAFYGLLLNAQSSTLASGGEGTGPGGTVSFSIGQLAVETVLGSQGSVSPGVQQTYESWVVSITDNLKQEDLLVYPNPVQHEISIEQISSFSFTNGTIFNSQGQIVQSIVLQGPIERVSVENLAQGFYILHLSSEKRNLNFTFIKQ
jgi:hypothetical protein